MTFDESAWNTRSNRILTVLLGDMVEPGVTTGGSYNHYNVLRTIEDNFGLECLAEGDCGACPIEGIWR